MNLYMNINLYNSLYKNMYKFIYIIIGSVNDMIGLSLLFRLKYKYTYEYSFPFSFFDLVIYTLHPSLPNLFKEQRGLSSGFIPELHTTSLEPFKQWPPAFLLWMLHYQDQCSLLYKWTASDLTLLGTFEVLSQIEILGEW